MTSKIKKARLPAPLKPKGNLGSYYKKLESMGYKFVSSGAFANVYSKGDHVIKVALSDQGYDAYLEYVLANQDNPYFPKVLDVKRFSQVQCYDEWSGNRFAKRDVTVVVMEKLKPGYSRKNDPTRPFANSLEKTVCRKLDEDDVPWLWGVKPFEPATEYAEQMVDVLTELGKQRSIDISESNVMLRGKQFVITDPVT